jgi:hypothetical protein
MNLLNDNEYNNIKSIFNNYSLIKKSENGLIKGNEIEFRFKNVDANFFYNLKQHLDDTCNIEKTEIQFEEIQYEINENILKEFSSLEDSTENVRFCKFKKIKILNGDCYFIFKKQLKYYNINSLNIKLAVNKEIEKKNCDSNKYVCENQKFNKIRYSYNFKYFRIDLTYILNGHGNLQNTFQIEIEILKTQISADMLCNILFNFEGFFVNILKIKYTLPGGFFSNQVIFENERQNIINKFNNLRLTNPNYQFSGTQPVTLQFEHTKILYKEDYAVTEKIDGERFYLFYEKNSFNLYLFDSNLFYIYSLKINSTYDTTFLIEGEYTETQNTDKNQENIFKSNFYLFDIIYYNKDIRENNFYNFHKRFDLLNDIIIFLNTSKQKNSQLHFYLKTFIFNFKSYPLSLKLLYEQKISNTEYDTLPKLDGLIFIPTNKPYPKTKTWYELFKWKPSCLNTIDFFVKSSENNKFDGILYVNNPNCQDNISILNLHEHNSHDKMNNEIINFNINENKTEKKYFICHDLFKKIDTITKQHYQENTVIEFSFNKNKNEFEPVRTRWDKTMNKNKWGNNINIVFDIWKSIKNPVEINNLISIKYNSHQFNDNLFNQINKNLQLALTEGPNYKKILEITFSDFLYSIKHKKNNILDKIPIKLYNINLSIKDLNESNFEKFLNISQNEKFDVILFNISIHHFFENQHSLDYLFHINSHFKTKIIISFFELQHTNTHTHIHTFNLNKGYLEYYSNENSNKKFNKFELFNKENNLNLILNKIDYNFLKNEFSKNNLNEIYKYENTISDSELLKITTIIFNYTNINTNNLTYNFEQKKIVEYPQIQITRLLNPDAIQLINLNSNIELTTLFLKSFNLPINKIQIQNNLDDIILKENYINILVIEKIDEKNSFNEFIIINENFQFKLNNKNIEYFHTNFEKLLPKCDE